MAHPGNEVRHNEGMLPGWDTVRSAIAENAWAAAVVLLTLFTAALTAAARTEIQAGTNWAFRPVARRLPWNRLGDKTPQPIALTSIYTLVDLFLLDAGGRRARYEKTTCFVVHRPTSSYREAVTAESIASGFATMRGTIVDTVVERGFYVSRIDFGTVVAEGERFTNIYSAELLDSFGKPHEHWTQEFLHPTGHLTLQVHFPARRPPKSVACTILKGEVEKPAESIARIVDLFGRKGIVWEVANPKLDQALKLGWVW